MQTQGRTLSLSLQSRKLAHRIGLATVFVLVTLGSISFMLPLFWMVSTSLKSDAQVYSLPTVWIPDPLVWENYPQALSRMPFWLFTRNSCITSFIPVIGAVLSSSMVAYAFSRLRWPGRDFWFIVLIATMMLPSQVTIIPLYIIYSKLNWINTFYPLTVPWFFGGAFYVFLLRQFFTSIPMDLSEAALMDGCSHLRIWSSIIIPLAKPALATVAVFTFLATWNDFFGPLLYLTNQRLFTLQVGLQYFRENTSTTSFSLEWQKLMAASLVVLLPTLVVFFVGQRFFVQGITLTGM
ncbi:MAG: carbohydrate ABC transporter permease, partial [Chloroflexi bacterium]|nr:carbohydrate ABC transporter permease [Chloroflexota bacterium]